MRACILAPSMASSPSASGTYADLSRALGMDDETSEALHAQLVRVLESGARGGKRKSVIQAKVRALLAPPPAGHQVALQLVPLLLAVRDGLRSRESGGRGSRARSERLDRGLEQALRGLAQASLEASRSRRRGRVSSGAATARDLFRRLVALTPDAVLTLRASGRLGLWSAAATRMTGRRRFEVARQGVARVFRRSDLLDTLLAEMEARGRAGPHEAALVNASGDEVPVRVYGARLKATDPPNAQEADSDPDRYLLLLHDMTEVQHIRRRLIETEKLSAMAKIAGSVAHEFRNPLNSLFLSTDLLEDELEGSEDVAESIAPTLAAIREEIERLNQIITHYLSLSKVSSASPEVMDLGEVVNGFAEDMRERLEQAGVTLRVRSDEGDHHITADPNQVRRILVNLVENAAHAVSEEDAAEMRRTRRGTVTLLVRRMRRSIKLTVKDNGPGIPDDLRERVFEPFFTSKAGGSGLGLYLVREIALASAGTMSLSSSEGRGTSVSVRWPFAEDVAAPSDAS